LLSLTWDGVRLGSENVVEMVSGVETFGVFGAVAAAPRLEDARRLTAATATGRVSLNAEVMDPQRVRFEAVAGQGRASVAPGNSGVGSRQDRWLR
jgi:hypothetical protein